MAGLMRLRLRPHGPGDRLRRSMRRIGAAVADAGPGYTGDVWHGGMDRHERQFE